MVPVSTENGASGANGPIAVAPAATPIVSGEGGDWATGRGWNGGGPRISGESNWLRGSEPRATNQQGIKKI